MSDFSASFLEIGSRELVRHLLRESGHNQRESVNPADILRLLGLQYTSFDFELELPADAKETVGRARPRALLSFDDRLVATDAGLEENRRRFSVLHEIGHFVLPSHQHRLYICDDAGLSLAARLSMEKEASEFAADLLFLGDRFGLEANSHPISGGTVKELADKYRASYEATARRLVEKSFQPCMLIVFEEKITSAGVDTNQTPTWTVKYSIGSPLFKTHYFKELTGTAPSEAVAAVIAPGRDIRHGYLMDLSIRSPLSGEETRFRGEFFSNTYNVFCLLIVPQPERSTV